MILNLITFTSFSHKETTLRMAHEVVLSELENHFTVRLIDPREIDQLGADDFKLLFLATGGVERMVIQHFDSLPHPFLMLTDGVYNSLSSALELAAWLQARGLKHEILHGELSAIVERIQLHYRNFKALRSLQRVRIGVMGAPTSELVSSGVDYLLAKRRWGVTYTDIPLERIYEQYDQLTNDEVGASCAAFASQALACREATPVDLLKAMRLYRAIRVVREKEKLSAVTLNCSKQMEHTGTTGCLALSMLNNEGVPASCKGDLQSVFTLLVAQILTNQVGFMASPSIIHSPSHEVIFAHCNVAIKLTDRYIIRNHFETNSGIAIQGLLPTGEVTILRCGSESLDEYYLATGMLVENTNSLRLSRTQIKVKIKTGVDYFLKRPLGNHHIILLGNHEQALTEFLQANGCKRVE